MEKAARTAYVAIAVLAGCGAPSWPDVEEPEPVAQRLSVTPSDPIAGEHVVLLVPSVPDGECYAWSGAVEHVAGAGTTELVVTTTSERACEIADTAGGASSLAFGALDPGEYVVRIEGREIPFTVRPAGTSPGELPLWWRVAHAVAVQNEVGSACVNDLGERIPAPTFRERAPRLTSQVAAAHPAWSPDQVESAMCSAQSVQVREVSSHELRYRHGAGGMCLEREVIGTVRVRADGSLDVSAPHVVSERHVPC